MCNGMPSPAKYYILFYSNFIYFIYLLFIYLLFYSHRKWKHKLLINSINCRSVDEYVSDLIFVSKHLCNYFSTKINFLQHIRLKFSLYVLHQILSFTLIVVLFPKQRHFVHKIKTSHIKIFKDFVTQINTTTYICHYCNRDKIK